MNSTLFLNVLFSVLASINCVVALVVLILVSKRYKQLRKLNISLDDQLREMKRRQK